MKRSLTVVFVCAALFVVPLGLVEAQDHAEDCLDAVVREMKRSPLQGQAWLDELNLQLGDCIFPKLEMQDEWLPLPEIGCQVTYEESPEMPEVVGPAIAVTGIVREEEVDFWLRTPRGELPESAIEDYVEGDGDGMSFFYRAYDIEKTGTYTAVFERDDVEAGVRFYKPKWPPILVLAVC